MVAYGDGFDVVAARAGGIEKATKAFQDSLNLQHRINTRSAGSSGTRNVRSKGEPSDQVARNDSIGAHTGALERCAVNEPRDRLVNLKLL
jgi:hypothetical protein